jgi:hypothetical protein
VPQRADSNTIDNPFFWSARPQLDGMRDGAAAGVHFVVFHPTSDDFRRTRLAMDGVLPDGTRLPLPARSRRQGINSVLTTTHRQNFLVPPRVHRSLPLVGPGPKEDPEILSFEATKTDSIADQIGDMVGFAPRTRVMGSLALTLCNLAAGRVDAVCSLKPARSVDIAAAQLLVRERGLAIDLPDRPPFDEAPLDVSPHSRVVAAATTEVCAELYRRLSAND